ncbi:phosphate/phosphite/phosphonate ABC transporter substrate-binding protein [Rhizobium sp. YIM 134829]|uniref:phosphate/phosphite/phosphonate ABC transporter substrate-binding protein n=1 Tax=Rhizobium sp. YIM 134829 TaxID=3390453 RepID=UPI003979DE6C
MSVAALAMYASPAPLAEASRQFWAALGARLRVMGLDAPLSLDESLGYRDAWLREDLVFAQTCGYPYVRELRSRVRLVATPAYDLPGCDGAFMRSFIVVAAHSPADGLPDLRGSRAAINDVGSNSGYNLFRHAIAPHAVDGRFFRSVTATGGHRASIAAIAAGEADCAAIDCVTFGNLRRFEPACLEGVRVLAETAPGPGLPFITAGSTSDADLASLRSALDAVLADPALADSRGVLALRSVEHLEDAAYERLTELEREAATQGYPQLA